MNYVWLQDLPVLQEQISESGMLPQSTNTREQYIPLPTHCLLFSNGVLKAWDGLWSCVSIEYILKLLCDTLTLHCYIAVILFVKLG